MGRKVRAIGAVLSVVVLLSSTADAQWVLLGRKALGAVQRLKSSDHDVATVLLEAEASKVYDKTVAIISEKENLRITYRDDRTRTIECTDGVRKISMKVSRLQEKLSQLIISSTLTEERPSDTSLVVDKVFRVCKEVGVRCSLAAD